MLTHPTLDKLRTLQLSGMLKALTEQQQLPEIETFAFEERACSPTGNSPNASTGVSRPACAKPICASPPVWKTSTCGRHGAWTRR